MNTKPGHDCHHEERIKNMDGKLNSLMIKMDQIVEAQVGSANGSKRGNNVRFEILENWRASVNKVLWALFIAALGFIGFIVRSLIIKGI